MNATEETTKLVENDKDTEQEKEIKETPNISYLEKFKGILGAFVQTSIYAVPSIPPIAPQQKVT